MKTNGGMYEFPKKKKIQDFSDIDGVDYSLRLFRRWDTLWTFWKGHLSHSD
jgi:hypothetical protein